MKYSKAVAEGIQNYLVEDDWHFRFDEERGIFKFGLTLKGRLNKVDYAIDVNDDDYIVYVTSPIGAKRDDPAQMAAIAEFICRANYGLKNGNFEFDFRDGEIRYKVFVPCEGLEPSRKMVKRSIHCAAGMFERYGEGILKILFADMSAKDAVEECEKDNESAVELIEKLSELLEGDDISGLLERLSPSGDAEGTEGEELSDEERAALTAQLDAKLAEIIESIPGDDDDAEE